jgi:transcriptional regulator with XRE-family HTH domain
MTVGKRIRAARERAGFKQADLAEAVDTDGNTISRWERGVVKLSVDTIFKLASALKTSIAYLMGETDDPNPRSASKISAERTFMQKINMNADNASAGDGTAIGISAMGNVSARTYKSSGNFFVYEYAQNGKSLRLEIPKEATREEIEQIIKGAKCATFE